MCLQHAHPAMVEALVSVAPHGSHFGQPVAAELEWGERVCRLIPCADKVRFVASGAEAAMLAMRSARGYTGKEKSCAGNRTITAMLAEGLVQHG